MLVNDYLSIAPDVKLGKDVKLSQFINLYGCDIGDETKIGAFVEIQKAATVGKRCKISSHTFICEGVTIEDHVFIGHSVTFINDSYPRATSATGELQTASDWKVERTLVKRGASIGSGATILSNLVEAALPALYDAPRRPGRALAGRSRGRSAGAERGSSSSSSSRAPVGAASAPA